MKYFKCFSSVIALLFVMDSLSAQYTVQDIQNYVETYKEVAINKMYEYKIPASITIAQGIFESAAGTSRLAVQGNNHFGIKCHNDWTGDTILVDDDELQECFRKYQTVDESYNDHSLFLKTRKRYAGLFELNVMDYVAWAHGLKDAGYATNPEYAPRLITIIEKYHLADLDTIYQQRLESGYFKNYPNVDPATAQTAVEPKPKTEKQRPRPVETTRPEKPKVVAPKQDSSAAQKPKEQPTPAKTEEPKTNDSAPATPAPAVTKPADPTPQTLPISPATNTEPQSAPAKPTATEDDNAASEVAGPEDKPTAITVFSARDGEYPKEEYPFTDRKVFVNNKTLFVIAQKGDNYSKIANDVQTSEKKLKKYNDVSGSAKLKVGQVVYIERKSKVGQKEYYKVVNAETLNYVAQKTGVQLDKICKYNALKANAKLKKGDVIKLKK